MCTINLILTPESNKLLPTSLQTLNNTDSIDITVTATDSRKSH